MASAGSAAAARVAAEAAVGSDLAEGEARAAREVD